MHKTTKSVLFILSVIFAGIFFYQSFYRVNPQNQSLQENYKIQKMNLYPPKAFRVANIVENRPEFTFYFRLENNFTEIFNFSKLYASYLELVILLLSLFSITRFFLASPKQATLLSLAPLLVLSFFVGTKIDLFFLFSPLILYSLLNNYG